MFNRISSYHVYRIQAVVLIVNSFINKCSSTISTWPVLSVFKPLCVYSDRTAMDL